MHPIVMADLVQQRHTELIDAAQHRRLATRTSVRGLHPSTARALAHRVRRILPTRHVATPISPSASAVCCA